MGFSVSIKKDKWTKPVTIFHLEGQLDSKSIQELEREILQQKENAQEGAWVMDLTKLAYISSAGVAIFIGLGYEAQNKGGLCFFGATSKVFSVFELLGLTDVFRFFASEEEAKKDSGI